MKVIETKYKGYRFRSRTEARWAVFFQTAGVPWKYEPEGFEDGTTRYLPDFKLTSTPNYEEAVKANVPDFGLSSWDFSPPPLFVEVKGTRNLSVGEKQKIKMFVEAGNILLIVFGDPSFDKDTNSDWVLLVPEKQRDVSGSCLQVDLFNRGIFIGAKTMEKAILAARSARFEHGECPA